jgi:hypothetical protein
VSHNARATHGEEHCANCYGLSLFALEGGGGGSAAEFCVGALPALVVLFLCAKAACCMITNADCNRLKARVLFLLAFLVYLIT